MGLGDASAGLGLRHPKSLSTQNALFLSRYRRGISEAHFCAFWRQALPGMPAMLGPRSTKRCKYHQTVRFAFAVAGSRAARSLLFSRWFSGLLARARFPSHKTLLFTVFCCICVFGLACGLLFLGCFLLGPLARARARDPMSAFWVGARMGPRKPASPALSGVKVGNMRYVSHATNMT